MAKLKIRLSGEKDFGSDIEATLIGRGGSADVYKISDNHTAGQYFALKVLRDDGKNKEFKESILGAMNLQSNPHYVKMDCLVEVEIEGRKQLALRMDYAGSDLHKIVGSLNKLEYSTTTAPGAEKRQKILRAFAYTTLLNLLEGISGRSHGDLLPPNVLVNGVEINDNTTLDGLIEQLVNPTVQMTDFMMSPRLRTGSANLDNTGFTIPLDLRELEQIQNNGSQLNEYDKKDDIYGSASIFLWLLSVSQKELTGTDRLSLIGFRENKYQKYFFSEDIGIAKEVQKLGRPIYDDLDHNTAGEQIKELIKNNIQQQDGIDYLLSYFVVRKDKDGRYQVLRPADYLKVKYRVDIPVTKDKIDVLKADYEKMKGKATGDELKELKENYHAVLERVGTYCTEEQRKIQEDITTLEEELNGNTSGNQGLKQQETQKKNIVEPLEKGVKDYYAQVGQIIAATDNKSVVYTGMKVIPNIEKYCQGFDELDRIKREIGVKMKEIEKLEKDNQLYLELSQQAAAAKIR